MPRQLPITQFMTSPVITVGPQTTVEEAVKLFAEAGVGGAPVVDDEGRLVGLLDDDDLLAGETRLHGPTTIELFGAYLTLPGERRRFEQDLRHALAQTVADVMDPEPAALGTDAVLEDAATVIIDRRVAHVPVVDADRRVVGIVTRGDLVKALYREGG